MKTISPRGSPLRLDPNRPGILVPANRWQLLKMLILPNSRWGNILTRRIGAQYIRHNPDRTQRKHDGPRKARAA